MSVVSNPLHDIDHYNARPSFVALLVLSYTFGLFLGVFPFQYQVPV